MTRDHAHPTRDELLVMAYVDDELAEEQRSAFQSRLANEPDLVRQVAVYQKLEVLARHTAPPEPRDQEWKRLRAEPLQRGGEGTGWFLLATGALALALGLGYLVLAADLAAWLQAVLITPCLGFAVLVLFRWRARRRLAPFDPYTEVRR